MSYSHGSTGTVTLGPDRLHFHIVFALRPTADGQTEGQTILVTRRRRGIAGSLLGRLLLLLTRLVGDYFARGDTRVFRSIRFDLRTPTRADRAIVEFIQHTERQPAVPWGLEGAPAAPPASRPRRPAREYERRG